MISVGVPRYAADFESIRERRNMGERVLVCRVCLTDSRITGPTYFQVV